MTFLKSIFGKKQELSSVLNFSVTEQDGEFIISATHSEKLKDFIRNNSNVNQNLPDEEMVYQFLFDYCLNWLAEYGKENFMIEHHQLDDQNQIKYIRSWNKGFIEKIHKIGFDKLPDSEEEIVDGYMNYIYSVRLLEEQEALESSEPKSDAHPKLSDPKNKFKE